MLIFLSTFLYFMSLTLMRGVNQHLYYIVKKFTKHTKKKKSLI